MKIMDKIKGHGNQMRSPGGNTVSQKIQEESVAAIMNGIGSPEWEAYMKNFHSNPDQLRRLKGEDQAFMQSDWAETILAYVVTAGVCGGGTGMSPATEDMTIPMQKYLDDNLNSTTAQTPDVNPVTADIERFLD